MPKSNSGFTLLELLLSAALMAFVLAVAAGMISGVIGGSIRISERVNEDSAAGEIEDVIADDLAFMVAPKKEGVVELRKEGEGDSYFSFYSACGAKTAWGTVPVTIHRVTYQVKPLPGGGKGLFRGEEPIANTKDAYYDAPLLVADRVRSFVVEGRAMNAWSPVWPAEKGGPMPALIRAELNLEGRDGQTRIILVEAVPAAELLVKPEAERRASGGGEPQAQDTTDRKSPAPPARGPGVPRPGR